MVRVHGHVKASLLVSEASVEGHPFYNSFEWDDTTAAHEYRLHQARRFIRTVYVKVGESDKTQPLIHVTVANKDEGEYHPLNVVLKCPSKHARAFAEVVRQWEALGVLLKQLAKEPEE
jgi:hypothetical protein